MNETTCYFCNKTLRNETAEQHASRCGYVLEPCVNKCGAYIARNMKSQHLQQCRNTRLKSAKSTESLLSASGYDTFPRSSNANFVRTGTLPHSYKHPSMFNLSKPAINYIEYPNPGLPNQSAYYKMAPTENGANYNNLKDRLQRSHQQHSDLIRQIEYTLSKLRGDLNMVQSQNKTIVEWRTSVQYQLDGIATEVRNMAANSKNDITTHRLQEVSKDLQQLRLHFNSQQVALKNEQIETRQFQNDIESRFRNFDGYFRDELQKLIVSHGELIVQVEQLNRDNAECKALNSQLQIEIDDVKRVLINLKSDFDKMAEKDKQNVAQICDLKHSLAQVNLNVEVTERSFENIQGLIATKPGRLIWKISDFALKMENAKANEKVPIKSPIFYTNDYGYRIRLAVHLNGLKKWRGRHLLACIHVLKGDYDDLLPWPCRIEANIILRDLETSDKPKDFTRYITAKRNYPEDTADDPQESSTQYLFIPHSTLLKSNHVKNDAIFLEILINNPE